MATNPNGTQYRPLFFYVVHEIEDVVYGTLMDFRPAWELEKRYEIVYHFRGREAEYWVATNDRSISRQAALQFSIACHNGRVRRYHCDLAPIGK